VKTPRHTRYDGGTTFFETRPIGQVRRAIDDEPPTARPASSRTLKAARPRDRPENGQAEGIPGSETARYNACWRRPSPTRAGNGQVKRVLETASLSACLAWNDRATQTTNSDYVTYITNAKWSCSHVGRLEEPRDRLPEVEGRRGLAGLP
jgi:hypothetical protein